MPEPEVGISEQYSHYLDRLKEKERIRFDGKSLFRIFQALLTLISIILVVLADGVRVARASITPIANFDYFFIIMLLASLVYLQFRLNTILMPIIFTSKDQKKDILSNAKEYYKRSFLYQTTGFGYFVMIVFTFLFFFRGEYNYAPNIGIMMFALLFILIGEIAKSRGVAAYLYFRYSISIDE